MIINNSMVFFLHQCSLKRKSKSMAKRQSFMLEINPPIERKPKTELSKLQRKHRLFLENKKCYILFLIVALENTNIL